MKIVDERGRSVKSDDPRRAVWYAVSCGYWSDDWDNLKQWRGIPCCPVCGSVGFQTTAAKWLGEALDEYDRAHPGYKEFLMGTKDRCLAAEGGFKSAYEKHVEEGKTGLSD